MKKKDFGANESLTNLWKLTVYVKLLLICHLLKVY